MCFVVKRRGFSLVEVLVVISTVSVVMAISMPAIVSARGYARSVVCRSNLRQLVLANMGYSNENDGFYVPAAEDLWDLLALGQSGHYRWHGKRSGPDEPFDPLKGPLADYLADGKVKECPARVEFTKDQVGSINFELGCGGYGYNMAYIGSRLAQPCQMTFRQRYVETPRMVEIKKPQETLMFADTAFYHDYRGTMYLIEYSFAEPPFFLINGHPDITGKWGHPKPSIHFRHRGRANIGWADGHVDPQKMAQIDAKNVWNVVSANMDLGWFEPVDNTLFDLE